MTNQSIKLSSRHWFFATLIGIAVILLSALYLQFYSGYKPCVLCQLQRIIFMLIACILFLAVIQNPRYLGIRIYSIVIILLTSIGNLFAIRQVWLQSLPAGKIPACGPNLNFMLQHMQPTDIIWQIFYGSGDCAKVDWRFLHLSFAGWAIAFFSLIAIIALWQFIVPRLSAK